MTEDDHLRAVIQWARCLESVQPELQLLIHYPGECHGGRAGVSRRRKGVRAGVPDLLLPVPRAGYHGLWIELKRPQELDERGRIATRAGQLSDEQVAWLAALQAHGYRAICCYGSGPAIEEITTYLSGSPRA